MLNNGAKCFIPDPALLTRVEMGTDCPGGSVYYD